MNIFEKISWEIREAFKPFPDKESLAYKRLVERHDRKMKKVRDEEVLNDNEYKVLLSMTVKDVIDTVGDGLFIIYKGKFLQTKDEVNEFVLDIFGKEHHNGNDKSNTSIPFYGRAPHAYNGDDIDNVRGLSEYYPGGLGAPIPDLYWRHDPGSPAIGYASGDLTATISSDLAKRAYRYYGLPDDEGSSD